VSFGTHKRADSTALLGAREARRHRGPQALALDTIVVHPGAAGRVCSNGLGETVTPCPRVRGRRSGLGAISGAARSAVLGLSLPAEGQASDRDLTCGSCLSVATQSRSEFCRTSPSASTAAESMPKASTATV